MIPNEIIWPLFLLFDFSFALLAIWFFGKRALYAIVIVEIIVCNMQVLKLVDLFGMVESFGNITYGSIFLATDLLGEVYGPKEARKAIWLGLWALIFMTLSMQFTIALKPHESDFSHQAMTTLFSLTPRIVFASVIAFVISQFHDIWAFDFWKRKTKGRFLWLRNNFSTFASQFIDTTVFVFIAFYGVYEKRIFLSIFFTTLVFKWIVALADTPILYLGRWILLRRESLANK